MGCVEEQLTEYAKKLNCDVISFYGRKGWKRPFKKIVIRISSLR